MKIGFAVWIGLLLIEFLWFWSKGFGGEEGVLKPVTVEYNGTQDPDIPIASFAVIVINESELLEKVHKVKARYSDGQVVSDMFNNNKAVILPIVNRKTLAELSEVTIYDKEGKELFRQ